MLKTSEDWQKECNVIIYDADGWDRKNFQYSWHEELISKNEFERRLSSSTCKFTKPILNDKEEINNIWNE
jgi:hypothetical protein